jgi:hypothetical protein
MIASAPDNITSKDLRPNRPGTCSFRLSFCCKAGAAGNPRIILEKLWQIFWDYLCEAANSKALDHLLFCFGSQSGKVASISVLAGLVPFLCGILQYFTTHRAIRFEIPRSFHVLRSDRQLPNNRRSEPSSLMLGLLQRLKDWFDVSPRLGIEADWARKIEWWVRGWGRVRHNTSR